VSTKTSKVLGKEPSVGDRALRSKGALVAAFIGVGAVGVFIGRATSPGPELPAAAPTQSASAASAEGSARPFQQFDLTENPQARAGIPLRPMDREIFAAIMGGRIERTRMNDLFPDRPYRVALVGSVAERRIGLVMIDMNRDGKFEERWDLKGNDVVRSVQQDPAAEGAGVKYALAHGRWQPR
jgi:hypothetical protein